MMAVTAGREGLLENMACDMKLLVHPTCNHYMHFARDSKQGRHSSLRLALGTPLWLVRDCEEVAGKLRW